MRRFQLVAAINIFAAILFSIIAWADSRPGGSQPSYEIAAGEVKTFPIAIGNGLANLMFVRGNKQNELVLREIQFFKSRTFYALAADAKEWGDVAPASPIVPASENCTTAPNAGVGQLVNSLPGYPTLKNCSASEKARIYTLADQLRASDNKSLYSTLACQVHYRGNVEDINESVQKSAAMKIENVLGGYFKNPAFSCSAGKDSSYRQETSAGAITLGKEVLEGSPKLGKSVLYHELLHSTGVFDEKETQSIVRCCSEPKGDEFEDCRLLRLYKVADSYKTVPEISKFMRSLIQLDSLSILKKSALITSFKDIGTAMCKNQKIDLQEKAKFSTQLHAVCNSELHTDACRKQAESFDRVSDKSVCVLAVAVGSIASLPNVNIAGESQGRASASPDSAMNGPAPIPQKIVVRPSSSTVGGSKEIKQFDRPLAVYAQGASNIGRRVMASVGMGVAHASMPSLPIENSGGSSTQLIGMRGANPLLNIGHGRAITATLAVPFSIENAQQAAPAEADIKFYDVKTGIQIPDSRVASLSAVEAASGSPDSQPSKVRNSRADEAGASTSDSQSSSGDSSGSGAGVSGSGTLSLNSSASNKSNAPAPSASSASDRPQVPRLTASTLKRLFVNSQDPAQAINAHIEDLREASMKVRYMCQWYPRDVEGAHEQFSLDTLQGRDCDARKKR